MEHLTLQDLGERFGTGSERRQELFALFEEWLASARSAGVLRRLWVYGSFCSRKPRPDDIDVFALVEADFDHARLPAETRPFFDPEFCRSVLGVDLFLYADRTPDHYLMDLLAFLRRDRMGEETMVEVIL